MSGSLIKVDELTVSTGVSSITLGGGSSGSSGLNTSIDSTFDVYVVYGINIESSAGAYLKARVTESGSAISTANYEGAYSLLRSYNTDLERQQSGATEMEVTRNLQGTGNNNCSFTMWIFNANNSSEYTYFTNEAVAMTSSTQAEGMAGGNVYSHTSSVDGLNFFFSSGNINSGRFILYGLKK